MVETKGKWVVKYVPWGSEKWMVKRFPTEPKARKFYMGLIKRRNPPANQGISEEKAGS